MVNGRKPEKSGVTAPGRVEVNMEWLITLRRCQITSQRFTWYAPDRHMNTACNDVGFRMKIWPISPRTLPLVIAPTNYNIYTSDESSFSVQIENFFPS